MQFRSLAVLSFAVFAAAAPMPNKNSLAARQNGPVLADTTFNDISIAGGQAGNAEAEALAVFSALDLQNPGNIDPADVKFLAEVNNVANDAEKEAFNPAVEAASGDEADQIQVCAYHQSEEGEKKNDGANSLTERKDQEQSSQTHGYQDSARSQASPGRGCC